MRLKKEIAKYKVTIPENIDLDQLLLLHPVNVPNAKDYLLYILSIIKIQEEFTLINSTKLQKKVDNYSPLLQWLIDIGIIIGDGEYKRKIKSKGYKFTEMYLTDLKEEWIYKKQFIEKLNLPTENVGMMQEPNHNNSLSDAINVSSGYGYEDDTHWMRTREIAKRLKLNSLKIKNGLIHFGLVSDLVYEHTERISEQMFYYKVNNNKSGPSYPVLYIRDELIERIKALAIENPDWFPPLKG